MQLKESAHHIMSMSFNNQPVSNDYSTTVKCMYSSWIHVDSLHAEYVLQHATEPLLLTTTALLFKPIMLFSWKYHNLITTQIFINMLWLYTTHILNQIWKAMHVLICMLIRITSQKQFTHRGSYSYFENINTNPFYACKPFLKQVTDLYFHPLRHYYNNVMHADEASTLQKMTFTFITT